MKRKIKIGMVQVNNSFSGQNYLPLSLGFLVSYAEFNENMHIKPIGQKRVYPKLTKNTFWDK